MEEEGWKEDEGRKIKEGRKRKDERKRKGGKEDEGRNLFPTRLFESARAFAPEPINMYYI